MTNAPDVIAVGETMLSLIAVGVPLERAAELRVSHGGAESNACAGLVRLGVRAAWVGRLGLDPAGDRVESELREAGLDLAWVRRDPERPTGVMLRETSGAPARYYRSGSAASALSPAVLDGVPIEDASAVLVTGITAMLGEGAQATAIALLERAGGLRVVDPNLRVGLWGSARARELVLPLLERSDLLLGGESELDVLIGGNGRELAERCRGLGPREVVLKRGPAGAAALGPRGEWIEWAPEPWPQVDPVGAGDAFNAGYLAARLEGRSVAAALERGARCGAGVAAAVGDTAGFPSPAELEGGPT
jgi:2-dehydro-3-deoxygluconokinase